MDDRYIIYLILQIVFINNRVSSLVYETRWQVAQEYDGCTPVQSVMWSKTLHSKEQCVQYCIQESTCALISFQEDTKTCEGYESSVPRQQDCSLTPNTKSYRNVKDGCTKDGLIYDRVSGLCVKVFITYKTWEDANEICRQNGLNLVIIDSYDKHMFIKNLVKSSSTWESLPYWIGGNAIQPNYTGQWRWWNSELMPTSNDYWIPVPVDSNDACASLCSSCDYQWHSFPCTHGVRFICEKTL